MERSRSSREACAGVLIHGCNLHIENWRYVAWGDPPEHIGRIPYGIMLALEWEAPVIVMGTGASEKIFRFSGAEVTGQKLVEAAYAYEYLKARFDELANFTLFRERYPAIIDPERRAQIKEMVLNRINLDCQSTNTRQEIITAGDAFNQHGVERVLLVSSPTHVIRCLRDAVSVYRADARFARFAEDILAAPSGTNYDGTNVDDVVVIEPPHRPDRHIIPTHRRMQRMLCLQNLPYEELVKLIEEFDDLLQRYEDRYFMMYGDS